MNKMLISLVALTMTVASAAPRATMMSQPITPKMTAAKCTKKGGMVRTIGKKQMCVMTPSKRATQL